MNIVYFACKNHKEAEEISKALISQKLAFCVNIIPKCYSIYRWKGKSEESNEAVVIVKTLSGLTSKLIKKVKSLHSYKMPEIIFWKISDNNSEILNWATKELE